MKGPWIITKKLITCRDIQSKILAYFLLPISGDGVKALGKKVADPGRDLESEYQEEKIKEKLD